MGWSAGVKDLGIILLYLKHSRRKYDNNGKGRYLQFDDDDNKMSLKNTYNPIQGKVDKDDYWDS